MPNVFVYGTLKRGGRLHGAMERADAKFVCTAKTFPGEFQMRSIDGAYPGIVDDHSQFSQSVVYGEIFEVEDEGLKVLDRVEGEGSLYVRRMIYVQDSSGHPLQVETYIYLRSIHGCKVVESGIWS